ncbi:MAG: hypothetical protein FWH02_01980 [Oscillospiraceae bacterium]|nr:hypothetical protein [Oscillospiraceae bacterium]
MPSAGFRFQEIRVQEREEICRSVLFLKPKTSILNPAEGKTPVPPSLKKEGASYGCFALSDEKINLIVALPSFLKRVASKRLAALKTGVLFLITHHEFSPFCIFPPYLVNIILHPYASPFQGAWLK